MILHQPNYDIDIAGRRRIYFGHLAKAGQPRQAHQKFNTAVVVSTSAARYR
jgi:hypothetical protein